jgi:hypothetical protein
MTDPRSKPHRILGLIARRSDLWQIPLALLLMPLWLPLALVGLAIVGGAELIAQMRGHETDPTLDCGCTCCMHERKHGKRPLHGYR